jgi:hypothetical protein
LDKKIEKIENLQNQITQYDNELQ